MEKDGRTDQRATENDGRYTVRASGWYHAEARCMDCDFTDDDYRVASKEAQEHVLKTGHNVEMVVGFKYSRETTDEMMERITGGGPKR